MAWLLDLCPPEYRTYPALRRHAVVLARFAVLYVEACQAAVNRGLSEARGGLREVADGLGGRGSRRDLAARVGASARRTTGGRSGRGGPPRPPVRGPALVHLGWDAMPRIAVVFLVDPAATSCSSTATSTRRARPTSGGWSAATSSPARTSTPPMRREILEETGIEVAAEDLVPLAGDGVQLLRRPPQRLPGVRRQGGPDRRRHRARRGSRDRLRRPGRRVGARPGRVAARTSCPGSWPPTSTASSATKGSTG